MNIDSNEAINIIFILCLQEFGKLCCVFVSLALDTLRIVTHLFLEREATHIEDLWELKLAIDFLVSEGVIIKDDSLQVDDENIWHLT